MNEGSNGRDAEQAQPESSGNSGERPAERYREMVDRDGSVRIGAGELVSEFGQPAMSVESREVVADELWEAGVRIEPSLVGAQISRQAKLKLVPVDEARVSAAVAWQQTPAGKRAALRQARYAVSPLAAGIAATGGALLLLALFLPLDESSGVLGVRSNTLIQHGYWVYLIVPVAIVVAALRCYSAGRRSDVTGVIFIGALAVAGVISVALDKGLHTLYPLGPNGEPEELLNGTVVPFGIAIYVAGVGVLLTLLGGIMMRQTATVVPTVEPDATTRCPDCAETILAAARVCKHCGARLGSAASDPTS